MSIHNYFIRGAVSVGEAYFDSFIQSGQAFIEAYQAESELAIYPRIILTEKAVQEARKTCVPSSDAEHSALNALFLVDSDGLIFVNYLNALFNIFDPELDLHEICLWLELHKNAVEQNLTMHKDNGPVYRKYQWSARYHDSFCKQIRDLTPVDYSISLDY